MIKCVEIIKVLTYAFCIAYLKYMLEYVMLVDMKACYTKSH